MGILSQYDRRDIEVLLTQEIPFVVGITRLEPHCH